MGPLPLNSEFQRSLQVSAVSDRWRVADRRSAPHELRANSRACHSSPEGRGEVVCVVPGEEMMAVPTIANPGESSTTSGARESPFSDGLLVLMGRAVPSGGSSDRDSVTFFWKGT